ncbi:hypothetical protein E2562_031050 [Oryza meyeriana var. granulata]|uniref:Uncharacterized protein n=1 Tax=Oryza meyeriana var. granulata TaxID=110450 RepID=A0A6G1FEI6_9ORYZ|nr:hypothetical protein E2562_031050 [Oryza meyeriana var. granulata]
MGGGKPSPISGGGADGGAFAFISKGWREVRDSASADLRQMRARADRELEHLLVSASALAGPPPAPPLPPVAAGAPIAEVEFVRKRIKPKIIELRRQYSSTMREGGWPPKASASLRVDLSGITAIRNAIVAEGHGGGRWKLLRDQTGDEGRKEWEVVRMIRSGLKQFERRSLSSEVFGGSRGRSEFVEKFKLSLKSLNKELQESKEVLPLDLTEILAYLVQQSGPFLDQLGIRRDLSDKLVETLYSKRNGRLMYHSLSADRSLIGNENMTDELDLRIARVLESTGYHTEESFWKDPAKYKISDNRRHVAIVTTASLPWMTGTAINPLFRAAYLARSTKQKVTLLVPWLYHPSNEFFKSFPNCFTYKTSEEFVARVKEAMANEPSPLTPEQRYNLSWEAATERFMEYSELDKVLNNKNGYYGQDGKRSKMRKIPLLPKLSDVVDGGLAFAHHCLTGNEILRLATGAIPGTRDYDKQQCIDLNLLPAQVQHPVYGW